MMQNPIFDYQTDRYWYRQYCKAVAAIQPGAHTVRMGDRVSVVLDAGGSGWDASWPVERDRFIAGGLA